MAQIEKLGNLINKIIKEELNSLKKKAESLSEGTMNDPDYKYYIINTKTKKIVSGWEYLDDAKEELKYNKENNPEANLKVAFKTKLYTTPGFAEKLNPDDDSNWGPEISEAEIKKELDEYTTFASNDGTYKGLSSSDKILYARQVDAGNKPNIVRRGQAKAQLDKIASKQQGSMPSPIASENKQKDMEDTQLESMPTGTEIAGQVAEIVDKLKTMSEGSEDPKKQKLAAKAMKQLESAKAALEALTAHETMLEQKQQQEEEKDAEKHVKGFKKHLTKLVKEPAAVEKIASKMDAKKMAELKKKIKSGELDEEKLARVMLQHSLKEGWIK